MRKAATGSPAPLHPRDIAVALLLAIEPSAKYDRLSSVLGISLSSAHAAVQRLGGAGLLIHGERRVNRLALHEFLSHGLRYAFPARPGATSRGVPTAHAGPTLRRLMGALHAPYVWPDATGPEVGAQIEPLVPAAPALAQRAPELFDLLTLADALRVGQARERRLATTALAQRLGIARTVVA